MDAIDSLRAACPSLALERDPAARDAAGIDALRPFRGRPEVASARRRPLAVATPADTREVVALVRWAARTGTALVVRGGGSGLMGGAAVLDRPAVVVSLARLDAVAVDADACAAEAGAGATLAAVDAAAAEHGLACGHDPWTVGVATVGGAVSTAGLGFLGGAAGGIRRQVLGLEAVLGDGTVLRTRPAPERSDGMDLGALLVGAEGTLGVVTRVTLALVPRPEERLVLGWRLPSFEAATAFAVRARRTGLRFTCLDAGTGDHRTMLHVVVDGLRGEAKIRADRAMVLANALGGALLPEREASAWWAERHAVGERWAASAGFRDGDWLADPDRPHFDYAHVGVPLAKLSAVRARTTAVARAHGVHLVEEGLWHWPELYSIVAAGPGDGVRATIDAVCRAAQEAGGAMEYCHGVGWKLAHLVAAEHGEALAAVRRVKRALDPAGILNPGKAGL